MKQIVFIVFSIISLAGNLYGLTDEEMDRIRYGSSSYDEYRRITYWGVVDLSIDDYHYGSGDAGYLNLVIKDNNKVFRYSPISEIQIHFMNEFNKYFGLFNLPFFDTRKGTDERLSKFQKEVVKGGSLADYIDQFQASEEARRNSLYGGHAGAIHCDVKVKRRDFPILYEIRCSISAKSDLSRSLFMEYRDIGFSTPDHIIGGIKTALTDMFKDRSSVFLKILRYKK